MLSLAPIAQKVKGGVTSGAVQWRQALTFMTLQYEPSMGRNYQVQEEKPVVVIGVVVRRLRRMLPLFNVQVRVPWPPGLSCPVHPSICIVRMPDRWPKYV